MCSFCVISRTAEQLTSSSSLPLCRLYHVPQDWLVSGLNTLTIFEELGGVDLSQIELVVSQMLPSEKAEEVVVGEQAVAME